MLVAVVVALRLDVNCSAATNPARDAIEHTLIVGRAQV